MSFRTPASLWFIAVSVWLTCCNGEFRFEQVAKDASVGPLRCVDDSFCGALHCDEDESLCVECTKDSQCAVAGQKICDPDLQRCVECRESDDCPSGRKCERTTHKCYQPCSDSTGEKCDDPTFECDERKERCSTCKATSDCAASTNGKRCDPDIGRCVECTANLQCPAERSQCDRVIGKCVACVGPTECASGKCVAGACVP